MEQTRINDFGSYASFRETVNDLTESLSQLKDYASSLNLENTARSIGDVIEKAANEHFEVAVVGEFKRGKSTLINRLVGKKVVNIGDRPGVTKNLGWIRIHKNIDLLDSPGILWPKLENQHHAAILASLSSIKEEVLDSQEIAIFILKIMNDLYPDRLKERYKINNIDFNNIEITLDEIAKRRGALQKGGTINYEKVYNIVIRDLKDGNFGKITLDRI